MQKLPADGGSIRRLGARTAQVTAPKDRVEALGLTYPRPNVVAALGSGEGPILLIGPHVDVVEALDRSEWAHDPFGGDVSEARSRDAEHAMRNARSRLRYSLPRDCRMWLRARRNASLIASVDDEERFDRVKWPGMTFLVEEGLAAGGFPLPDMTINSESSGLDRVCGSFKGRLSLEITVFGEAAHASTPYGVSAIEKALVLISRLEEVALREHELQGSEM